MLVHKLLNMLQRAETICAAETYSSNAKERGYRSFIMKVCYLCLINIRFLCLNENYSLYTNKDVTKPIISSLAFVYRFILLLPQLFHCFCLMVIHIS